MLFDILSSRVHFSREEHGHSTAVSFDVVPKDHAYLEIGDGYVLAGNFHLRMLEKERQPVKATISLIPEVKELAGDNPAFGSAVFYREHIDDVLGGSPPSLHMRIVVAPQMLDELVHLRIDQPGSATIHASIDDLEYGWEPDGSHLIWKLPDELPRFGAAGTKTISGFSFNHQTFATTQAALGEEEDRKTNEWLADSPDPEAQRAAIVTPPPKDESVEVLRQMRLILMVLAGLVAAALIIR